MIYKIVNKLKVNINAYLHIDLKKHVIKRVCKSIIKSKSYKVNKVFIKDDFHYVFISSRFN